MTTADYPRCSSCKHWDNSHEMPGTFPHRAGFGECSLFESEYANEPNTYPLAFYDPADPYTGGVFKTAPDFGCLGHEPREGD